MLLERQRGFLFQASIMNLALLFDMIDVFNFKDMKYGVMLYVYRGVYYLN